MALEMLQDMQEDFLHRYRRLMQPPARTGAASRWTPRWTLRDCGEEGAPPSMKTICRATTP